MKANIFGPDRSHLAILCHRLDGATRLMPSPWPRLFARPNNPDALSFQQQADGGIVNDERGSNTPWWRAGP